eukprot:c15116_g1_i2 orf=116-379(-)
MDKVEMGEVLSNHKPITLEGKLQGEIKWSAGYFKINTTLVGTKEGKAIVEEALHLNMPWLGVAARIRSGFRQLGKTRASDRREEDTL